MAKKIKPGKGGSPYEPYDAPKEDPKNPYVPAPRKAKAKNIDFFKKDNNYPV